jgi:poly(3-hydroxybutyrate) depolymerase
MGLHRLAVGLAFVAASGAAVAGWNASPESIEGHPTWIYTPSTAMPNGKHPLLIVLHGCMQSHTELKQSGNLVPTAEANGIVLAVPFVGNRFFGLPQHKCWDYNGARDFSGHMTELVRLTDRLKARASLQIEPSHVYIVGLSSGGAMSLAVGCKAPDVFAGIGAVAGPSAGSDQTKALENRPAGNVAAALAKCRSLAQGKASHFATQIANIAYGDMDKNGPKQGFPFSQSDTSHAGQYSVVDIHWSDDNVQVLRDLYGTGPLDTAQAVRNGLGTLQVARKDGKPRLSLLVAHDVGHAWPAGSGRPNNFNDGGRWIAQSGLNYPEFVAGWLIGNNRRAAPVGAPELTLSASAASRTINATGIGRDPDGSIARIDTVLLKRSAQGAYLRHGGHEAIAFGADGRYDDKYEQVPDNSWYKVQVTATDNNHLSTTALSPEVKIGNPPALEQCTDFTDNNFSHVARGRALQCSFAFVCAKGSGDNLGLFSLGIVSTVSETSATPGVFRKGACPQP